MDWRIRAIGTAYEDTAGDLVTALAVMVHTAQVWQVPVEVQQEGTGILVARLDPKDITDKTFRMTATDDASLAGLMRSMYPDAPTVDPVAGASSLPRTAYTLPDARPKMLRSDTAFHGQAPPDPTVDPGPPPQPKPPRSSVNKP